MARVDRSAISCGVYQLHGLSGQSHTILKRLMAGYKYQAREQKRQRGFAQVIFSDQVRRDMVLPRTWSNGGRFMAYLQKQFPKIKHVELISKDSPSTGNTICTWIVNIPHPEFRKHKYYAKTLPLAHYDDLRRRIEERIHRINNNRWPY